MTAPDKQNPATSDSSRGADHQEGDRRQVTTLARVRDVDRFWADPSDDGLTELGAYDGMPIMAIAPNGDCVPGEIVHDGQIYAARLVWPLHTEFVRIRRRGVS